MAFDANVSAKQTGYNAAATFVAAMATAGLLESVEQAKDLLDSTAESVYTEIRKAAKDAPTRQPSGSASSMDLSNPGEIEFASGKWEGSTIAAVADEAPDYLDWYAENVKKGEMVKAVKAFLEQTRAGV